MFFVLSKILFFLLLPVVWILVLCLLLLLSKQKRRKKALGIAAITITLLFSNNYLYTKAVMAWQPALIDQDTTKHYNVGILLGGMYSYDKHNRGFFNSSADRFIQAIKLYHSGIINKVLMTGGTGTLSGKEPKEAFGVKKELLACGVHDTDIIIESNSRNTYENAIYSKRILDSLHINGPYLLITSATHMPRSLKVFTKAGFKVDIHPCDYGAIDQSFSFDDWIPDPRRLNDWSIFIKEIVGTIAYSITGKA